MGLLDLPSPEGLHSYVEKHFGRWTARIVGGLVILAICSLAIGLIWGVVKPVYDVITSTVQGRTINVQWSGVVGPGISVLLVLAFGWYVLRRIKADSHHVDLLSKMFDSQFDNLGSRVTAIETSLSQIVPPLDLSSILGLTIVSARYGAKGRFNDVTQLLNGYVHNDTINVVASNQMMGGDPCPRTHKALHITYRYRAKEQHLVVDEDGPVKLPVEGVGIG
jgi:Domain of unknown function (DUF3395)